VGEKVFEMKIDFGPGYRVYYTKHGQKITILLMGGDKKTQAKDIKLAQRLARNL
jgi:putative addiction module killer protein